MTETVKDADQRAQSYSRAVEDATLETIRLVSSGFKMGLSFRESAPSDHRMSYHDVKGLNFDADRGLLFGVVSCRCSINNQPSEDGAAPSSSPRETNSDDPSFSVKADYLVLFRLAGDHDRADAETFFTRVAPLSVWPYFRVHVAATATQANVTIPVLPIRKLVHRVKAAQTFVDPNNNE